MIHFLVYYGSAALVGLLFVGIVGGLSDLSRKAQPSVDRTDYELCQEVEREVNLQVGTLLTQEEADRISHRCYTDLTND